MTRRILFSLFLSIVIMSVIAPVSFAAVPIPSELYPEGAPTVSGQTPTGQSKIGAAYIEAARVELTRKIVNAILGIAGAVAIFSILNNAWWLVTSGGREEVITQHKKGLMWAIVGLILIILSYSIIRFVISIPFQANEAPHAQQGQQK